MESQRAGSWTQLSDFHFQGFLAENPENYWIEIETISDKDHILDATSNTETHSKHSAQGESEGYFLKPQKEWKLCLRKLGEETS